LLWDASREVKEMRNVYETRACEWRRLFWPQDNSKKTELLLDADKR
jgi:hypothetical protein